jgi:hypothetical protein
MAVIEPFDSTGVYRDDNGVKRYRGIADSVVTLLRRTVEERPDQEAVVELDGPRVSYRQLWDASARVAGEEYYRSGHAAIKDATYRSLLKRTRAELHEHFVDWAEPINRERGREIEFEEILGYHLEQAYRYRTELARSMAGDGGWQTRRGKAVIRRPAR